MMCKFRDSQHPENGSAKVCHGSGVNRPGFTGG